ncbi:hypothetical protein GWI33_018982 [Rhynchophorus ferrugineus]|uniref:Uncharacterized protein n=1 Tax=Rhynchophorus ferrugineus TaxID=354439 RepID=A0A834I692_RHYFE|nr:hypothetical protein GWI33_018982 [Rhynchophorus ferrugineus]
MRSVLCVSVESRVKKNKPKMVSRLLDKDLGTEARTRPSPSDGTIRTGAPLCVHTNHSTYLDISRPRTRLLDNRSVIKFRYTKDPIISHSVSQRKQIISDFSGRTGARGVEIRREEKQKKKQEARRTDILLSDNNRPSRVDLAERSVRQTVPGLESVLLAANYHRVQNKQEGRFNDGIIRYLILSVSVSDSSAAITLPHSGARYAPPAGFREAGLGSWHRPRALGDWRGDGEMALGVCHGGNWGSYRASRGVICAVGID